MIWLERWRRRGQAERFDLWTRVSFCVLVGGSIPVAWQVGASPVVLGYAALQVIICLVLVWAGLDHYLGRRSRPVRLIVITAGFTVMGVVIGAVAYPDAEPGHPDGPASLLVIVLACTFVTAVASAVPLPVTAAVVVAAGVTKLAVSRLEGAPMSIGVPAALALCALLAALVLSCRASIWTLKVVWELDHARKAQARLAVAEERLRFSRDLHDVVGRNLSVVAIKSELAARLVERGRPGAVEEMREVHQIAQDALGEMRAVVRGYRTADLDAELAGARSVLASAGVRCQVIGDGQGLPAEAQSTLGWVVREGTTNVLRHSEAGSCTVSLRRSTVGDTCRLTLVMENDGVTGPEPLRGHHGQIGTGLPGLTERLTAVGGRVLAERMPPDRFRLTAELPLSETMREGVR